MAYQVDEEDKNQAGTNAVPTGQGSGVVVPNSGVTGQNQAAPNNNAQTGPTSSGSFTNIQKYLDANADQAKGLGEQVAKPINDQSDQARTSLTSASDDFTKQVKSGTPSDQSPLLSQFDPGQAPTYVDPSKALSQSGSGPLYSTSTDYTKPQVKAQRSISSLTPDEQAQLQKAFSGQYTGPQNLESQSGYSSANDLANQAAQMGTLAGSESGRYQLLNQVLGRPNYTLGQHRLDNALIQGSPEAQEALTSASKNAAGLNGEFTTATQNADALVKPAIEGAATAKTNSYNAIQQAIQDYENNVQARMKEGSSATGTARSDLQNKLNSIYKLAPSDSNYGSIYSQLTGKNPALTPLEGSNGFDPTQFSGIKPGDYVKGGNASISNIISPEEDAELQGLSKLAGSGYNFVPDPSQEGSFNPNVNFDRSGYESALSGAASNYQNALRTSNLGPITKYLDPTRDYSQSPLENLEHSDAGFWANLLNQENSARSNAGLSTTTLPTSGSVYDYIKAAQNAANVDSTIYDPDKIRSYFA